jgi:two-component system response regulator YesN
MEQAKRLLEMGTYKVYEVANKSGFRDVKHFMKTFRELNGMSAGEWAKIHSRYSED